MVDWVLKTNYLSIFGRSLTFIGPFAQLLIVGSLLHQVQNVLCELRLSQWVGFRIHFLCCLKIKFTVINILFLLGFKVTLQTGA